MTVHYEDQEGRVSSDAAGNDMEANTNESQHDEKCETVATAAAPCTRRGWSVIPDPSCVQTPASRVGINYGLAKTIYLSISTVILKTLACCRESHPIG